MKVIALDLEGTLISNAMSQIPRPGLYEFLESCKSLCERVVIFTTVKEPLFRKIGLLLVEDGLAPSWFAEIEYVNWTGPTKDLGFIPDVDPKDCVLVDDFHIYVHPGQEAQWIEISQFDHPYKQTDCDLARVLDLLKKQA